MLTERIGLKEAGIQEPDIIEKAETVVGEYSTRMFNEALRGQKVCRCRNCTNIANSWADWIVGKSATGEATGSLSYNPPDDSNKDSSGSNKVLI